MRAKLLPGTARLIGRQRARIPKRFLLSPAKAALYAAGAAATVLLASVDTFGGALALGWFAGLGYARQNMLVTAPVYVLSVIAFSPSPWTLLFVSVPVVVFAVMYAVCTRLRKRVRPVAGAAATLVTELPHAVLSALSGESVTACVLCAVLAGAFAFVAQTICYAVFFRGIKTRLTPDELIAGGIAVVVFCYAAAGVRVQGLSLVFMFVPFFSVLLACGSGAGAASAFAVLAGAGGTLSFGDALFLAYCAVSAGAASALRPFTKWASAAGTVVAYVVMWQAFAGDGWGWQNLIAAALGAGCAAAVPARFSAGIFGCGKGTAALNGIVNRNRAEMSGRLMSVSKVFYDMSGSLAAADDDGERYTPERLADEVARNYCGRCPEREGCFAALGGSTAPVIRPMAEAAMSRGKVTILDMPPFVTSRCGKMYNLAAVVSSAAEAYRRRSDETGEFLETKRLMSEQFAGVSLVLDSLARECGGKVSFGEEMQERIGDELLRHNIVAGEIVTEGEGESVSVALTVRASDAEKPVLPRIVSSCLGVTLERTAVSPRGDECVVHLAACSVFEVAYGVAEKRRDGESVSGDSCAALSPSRRRRLFALSDGMGSGECAARSSKDAISMVENFYRAGFDNAVILTLVNKLLCLGSDENFSSLDIAVVDTSSGGFDIIKMGAVPTFIRHRGGVETVSCAAPPAGIIERATPLTVRRQLYDGDIAVMMSDGVFDALDEQGVIAALESASTANPQTLADRLLAQALSVGAEDDCTVLVLRLYTR